MVEVFTTYFIIKAFSKKLPIGVGPIFDILMWNVYLVVPTFLVIMIASQSIDIARALRNHIEKYSNYCNNDIISQKVNSILLGLTNL